ncbi:MAG: hypothetical protein CME40_09190 [Haliea sp.]|mgnify:CR=1 FL=1|nr:hypothetical protein [Haliea sp.]|tara:strand:+ start:225888 stop:227360 length:1473 start_codon:yes stop_codon:yes gene_type:complete
MTESNLAHDLRPKPAPDDLELPTLPDVIDRAGYPLEALGELLGSTARAIATTMQAPPEIAAHAVLSVAAFAAQDKADVAMDGRIYPLSLFMLTVAESGDRKSACDKVASRPLEHWQRERALEYRTALKQYHDEKAVYDATHRQLVNDKKKAPGDKAAALARLIPPVVPAEPIVIAQEPTLEGLQRSFRRGKPSQALFSDEGGQFFGGHAMNPDNMLKTIAGLSKYWDGAAIFRTRAADGETSGMWGRRLSIHLQVQPRVASGVLSDRMLLEQGLLARFLIAESRTLAGSRLYKPEDANQHPAVVRFHQRIAELLEHESCTGEDGGLELPHLRPDDDATALWVDSYNRTEVAQARGALLEIVKPHASKAAEQVLRLAGVFAVLEGAQAITQEQMGRAWTLATYYLQNALRAAQLAEQDHAHRQARELLEWLKAEPGARATIKHMQKCAPAKLRKRVADLRAMLALLEGAAAVRVIEHNSRGHASAWEVVPA